MRTHRQIVNEVGAAKLADQLDVSIYAVRSWVHKRRKGIPGEYWVRIAALGHATLEELALAAATPRQASSEAA